MQLFQITRSYAYGLFSNMQKISLEKSYLWQLSVSYAGENIFLN